MRTARAAAWATAAALLPQPAPGQTPARPEQDALDLQARSNVVQGAGARALGMAGAFLARPDDATAVSWNPAGLSYLRLPELSAVGTFASLRIRTLDAASELARDDRRRGRTPDFLAGTYPLELGAFTGSVQLSFQRTISFDFDRTIESGTSLRQFETQGGFDVVALGSGLQFTRRLRGGFSINRWLNGYSYTLDRMGGRPSRQSTDFSFSGWNFNLGTIWSPVEELNLAAVYKTGFTADVALARSRTDFQPQPTPPPVPVSNNSFERDDVALDFPAAFGLGASWRPRAPLTLSADYTRTRWSTGRIRNYFTLPPTGVPQPPEDSFAELPYPSLASGVEQDDTEQFRAGVEYVVIRRGLKWPLRAGVLFDRQLFRTTGETSGAIEGAPVYRGFAAGTGLIVGRVLVDVAYLYEFGSYREVDLEATDRLPRNNSVRSHRLFLSLIYRHRR